MWVAGEYGFFVIGIFLFITFGNGFRYGRRYLFGCQLLCILGLVPVYFCSCRSGKNAGSPALAS